MINNSKGMIGIDEVGRGSWAGPLLVVAARKVISLPRGLKDSKILSLKQREAFYVRLQGKCEFGEGWVDSSEVDQLGLTQATMLGVERALTAIKAQINEEIIVDGHINYCSPEFMHAKAVIGADAIYPIVSAASIYGKVTRDNFMRNAAKTHPHYGFETHVGYGTKSHRDAIKQFGVCALHRKSYAPIKRQLKLIV